MYLQLNQDSSWLSFISFTHDYVSFAYLWLLCIPFDLIGVYALRTDSNGFVVYRIAFFTIFFL